jgi:hypothetical protein
MYGSERNSGYLIILYFHHLERKANVEAREVFIAHRNVAYLKAANSPYDPAEAEYRLNKN